MRRLQVAALGIALSSSAGAQQADTTGALPDTASVARLDRIVITALRLPSELGAATYAAAHKGPDFTRLARPGLGLNEPLHAIPGVQVDNRFNYSLGERITVRGFGARTQFGVRGVRVMVDGIPATMPDGQTTLNHLDLGTIESVEVIRTPAAAVHGNAAGGVIAMRTSPPPESPLAIGTRTVAGSDGLLRTQFDIGGTTDQGSYLVHVGRLAFDGYRDFNTARNRYFSARTTTNLRTADLAVVVHQVRFDAENPGALPDSMVRDPSVAFPTNVAQRTGQSGRHSQAGVTLQQPLGAIRLSTSAYGVRREFVNPILPRIIDLTRRAGGGRVALGSADPATRVQWEAGFESALQKDDRLNHTNVSGERGALTLDQDERVLMRAAMAAARTHLGPRITVEAGIRRDATEFSVRDHLISDTNPDDSGERAMRAWSPSVGVSASVADGTRIFVNYGTAFETPTTTELANRPDGAGGFNPDLRPQRTRSFEGGVNGFGQRLYYQAALYRSRVSGALVPFEVPNTPGRQFFRNAATATHRGVELMVGGSALTAFEFRAAYTWTDARYGRYVVGTAVHDGKRLPGIAPHRLETVVRFTQGRAFIDLESRYQSWMPANDDNSARSASYLVHSVRGGARGIAIGGMQAVPYAGIENLFDRQYVTAVTVNAAAGRFYEPGRPRSFYAGLDLSFPIGTR